MMQELNQNFDVDNIDLLIEELETREELDTNCKCNNFSF
jgi:hypothetical protein